ncbi:photosystem II protein PsbQ [Pleurocapsales cyanobacterium LEGE 10410]|nr:photosystem II protein PsbQ [Pleurocapsales cyanobacterium LEGE 10410]
MRIFRPILSLILVLATTLLVSCGGPTASAPPTYTPEKLQKVKTYRIPLDIARQRLPELGEAIAKEDWVNADSFLHGPLGSIRRDLTYLSNALLPDEQEPALDVAKDIFKHFENIDAAVDEKNYTVAINQFKEVSSDLDAYASLIPQTEEPKAEVTEPEPVDQAEAAMEDAERVFEGVKANLEETIDEVTPDFGDDA